MSNAGHASSSRLCGRFCDSQGGREEACRVIHPRIREAMPAAVRVPSPQAVPLQRAWAPVSHLQNHQLRGPKELQFRATGSPRVGNATSCAFIAKNPKSSVGSVLSTTEGHARPPALHSKTENRPKKSTSLWKLIPDQCAQNNIARIARVPLCAPPSTVRKTPPGEREANKKREAHHFPKKPPKRENHQNKKNKPTTVHKAQRPTLSKSRKKHSWKTKGEGSRDSAPKGLRPRRPCQEERRSGPTSGQ